jgi:hypothetical protein
MTGNLDTGMILELVHSPIGSIGCQVLHPTMAIPVAPIGCLWRSDSRCVYCAGGGDSVFQNIGNGHIHHFTKF